MKTKIIEIFAKHYNRHHNDSGKEFDDTVMDEMYYAMAAMREYAQHSKHLQSERRPYELHEGVLLDDKFMIVTSDEGQRIVDKKNITHISHSETIVSVDDLLFMDFKDERIAFEKHNLLIDWKYSDESVRLKIEQVK